MQKPKLQQFINDYKATNPDKNTVDYLYVDTLADYLSIHQNEEVNFNNYCQHLLTKTSIQFNASTLSTHCKNMFEQFKIESKPIPDINEDNQTHLNNIQKYKNALHKRLITPTENATQVKIADIIAIQSSEDMSRVGEFHYPADTDTDTSQNDTVKRIFSQVTLLGEMAKKAHLKANFDNPDCYIPQDKLWKQLDNENLPNIHQKIDAMIESKQLAVMKPNCKNKITRITTNEFYFYPRETSGPLSESAFAELLKEIEKYAKDLPENIHLALASFPVMNEQKEVYNVTAYVQSGPIPQLNVFAKAFPSRTDAEYPDTTTRFYNGQKVDDIWAYQFFAALEHYNAAIQIDTMASNEIVRQEIAFLLEISEKTQTFYSEKVVSSLTQILKFMDNPSNGTTDILSELYDISDLCSDHFNDVSNAIHQAREDAEKVITTFSPRTFGLSNIAFGGQINCTTAGGLVFKTAMDICLDHSSSVAKETTKKRIEYAFAYRR